MSSNVSLSISDRNLFRTLDLKVIEARHRFVVKSTLRNHIMRNNFETIGRGHEIFKWNKHLLLTNTIGIKKSPLNNGQNDCHRIPVNNIKRLKNEEKTLRKHL